MNRLPPELATSLLIFSNRLSAETEADRAAGITLDDDLTPDGRRRGVFYRVVAAVAAALTVQPYGTKSAIGHPTEIAGEAWCRVCKALGHKPRTLTQT